MGKVVIEVDFDFIKKFLPENDYNLFRTSLEKFEKGETLDEIELATLKATLCTFGGSEHIREIMDLNIKVRDFHQKRLLTMKVNIAFLLTVTILGVISLVTLFVGFEYPEIKVYTSWLLFLLNTASVCFMIYSKEFIIGENFRSMPLFLKLVWWPILVVNMYHMVTNAFDIIARW